MHPHTHHTGTHGFVDRPRWSDEDAGQMVRYYGWWTKNGMIGLRPQTRVKGVGRHNNNPTPDDGRRISKSRPCFQLPLLLFAMIRSIVKSIKVPVVAVAELTHRSHRIPQYILRSGVRCKRKSVSRLVVKLHSQYRYRLACPVPNGRE